MTSNRHGQPSPMPSSTPSSLYVSKSLPVDSVEFRPLCNCGRRFQCNCCRKAIGDKRKRSAVARLEERAGDDGELWTVLLTTTTCGDWIREVAELWRRWTAIGKRRSQLRFRKHTDGLAGIRLGVASLHLCNSRLAYSPHLHAVFATDPSWDQYSIIHAWDRFSDGFAGPQVVMSTVKITRYSILGEIPDDMESQAELATVVRGVRLVRSMGR